MSKYIYKLSNNGQVCKIYLPSRKAGTDDKYLGEVLKDGQVIKAVDCWLPVSRALAELGVMSKEDAIKAELGF